MIKVNRLVVPILMFALVLAACGGGDDDDPTATAASTEAAPQATESPASSPTQTEPASEPTATEAEAEPTATRADVEASPDASPDASPPATGFTDDEAALIDLLLATNDLSGEWNQLRLEAPEDSEGPGICGAERFPQADERIAEVEVEYQSDDNASFILQNLTQFPEEVAIAAIDYIRETATCDEWTDESGTVFNLSATEAPDVGDESHALHVSFQVADAGTLEGDFIYVRVGGHVTIVTTLTLDEYDPNLSIEVATLAAAKLRAGTMTGSSLTDIEEALIERLLTLADVPGDWDQLEAEHRSDPESWTGLCDADLFPDSEEAHARVAVELYEGFEADSASLQQLLVSYPPDIAAEAFEYELEAALCSEFSRGDADVLLERDLDFPALGDDSFALRFTLAGEDDEVVAEGYWIVILAGDALTTLIYTDPEELDIEVVEEIARTAVDRMSGNP